MMQRHLRARSWPRTASIEGLPTAVAQKASGYLTQFLRLVSVQKTLLGANQV